MFIGLDENQKPVYLEREIWREAHTQLMGATRTGKGVIAGVLAAQGVLYGDAIIVMDPKGDRWLPHVLQSAAEEKGVKCHNIDLRPDTPPQFNILHDITGPELELVLDAGLGFEESGNKGSDYYAKLDRRTLRRTVQLVKDEAITMPELLSRVRTEWPDLEKENSGFLLALEELAELSCLHTKEGLNLEQAIRDGDVIYVTGDMMNTRVVKLQKMVLLRILQLVNRRKDHEDHRHVSIYLDEFKYFLSRIALNAMGTILHKGCNIILSHQTRGDLRACPGIDPEEVLAVVQSNAQIRIFYRLDLPEDALFAAQMTGLKIINKERRIVERNSELAEITNPERTIDETQVHLFDTNILQSLPSRCAVIFAPGYPARLAITSPYPTERKQLHTVIAPPLPHIHGLALQPEEMI